ncbi:cytochrome P450 [Acinetobacter tandoii]|nr:cytochrome P450 [Acinetobacter tandoii]
MTIELIKQPVLPWSSPDFVKNPYGWYDTARKNNPIYLDTDGVYVITRYEDIVKYGKLPSLSIREPDGIPKGAWKALSKTVINLDPPEHTAARRPINKWFTPKLVKRWAEGAEESVLTFLDKVKDGEIFEASVTFGVKPTHAAMCKALQVPTDEEELAIHSMHKAMRALSAVATEEDDNAGAQAFDDLAKKVDKIIAYKRANPGDGMADALLEMVDNGQMELATAKQSISLLWGSGGHNPSYIIGAAIEYFARNPEIYEQYKAKPEIRSQFLNEIYRLYPPELTFSRFTTEEIVIHDVVIPAKNCIKFVMDSANRDESIFPKPHEMDLTGEFNATQNMSFGMGAHQCAGQTISRGGIEAVLQTLVDNVDKFILEAEPEMENTDRSRSYVTLPISIIKKQS